MPAHTTAADCDDAPDDSVSVFDAPNSCDSSLEPTKDSSGAGLGAAFSSALMTVDKEIGQVLHEIEELSKALRSQKPAPQALRVASHPAVWQALKHAVLERELRSLALSDELTCLYNRRGCFAAAAQQLKLARRMGASALLWFCDFDGLKIINDSFGHREGDLALIRTANALQATFRDADVVGRVGGDEFVALTMNVSEAMHQQLLARLRKALKQAGKGEIRYKLSLSIGTAWFDPRTPVSLGQLMERADRAMYERKRGRIKAQSASRMLLNTLPTS